MTRISKVAKTILIWNPRWPPSWKSTCTLNFFSWTKMPIDSNLSGNQVSDTGPSCPACLFVVIHDDRLQLRRSSLFPWLPVILKHSCIVHVLLILIAETDLHNVIKRGNILKDVHKRYIMYQLFKATKYLHSGNVIHRDQKVRSECFYIVLDKLFLTKSIYMYFLLMHQSFVATAPQIS